MADDVFSLHSRVLPSGTRLVAFRGTEAISRLYAFEIFVVMSGDESERFDIEAAIGAQATISVHDEHAGEPFELSGVFSSITLLHQLGQRALFRVELVPRLFRLTLTQHSRVFTKMTVPAIIEAVLEDGGLEADDYELRLVSEYAVEEHVCQYRESNFDFISRWMEREGLYYFFEHEGERDRLIITDSKSIHERLRGPVRYHPIASRDVTADDRLESFTCQHLSLPAQVRVRDYDYLKPTLDVSSAAPVSTAGFGEISIHGARVFTPDQSKHVARIRAEELRARKVVIRAAGSAPRLRAGYVFELEEHPRPSFNAPYLATEVTHSGNQSASTDELKRLIALEHEEVYRVEITAIPADVQFRAAAMTPWPRVYGTENGVVCGPAESEYAQIDEHGRYAVKLTFDESDRKQGRASTYVRMLQPHGGAVEGFHCPLRKGTEVLLTFLGGDPDRPVIAGVVPNLHTPSPVTSGNNTKNVIQTGGRNRIEMEDRAGQQRITVSTPHANTYLRMGAPNAQHELIVHTDQNALLDAKQNWDVTVGGHLDERVTGTVYEEYHDTKTERVTGVYDVYYHSDLKSFINGKTSETFNGARETYSWGTVKEEVGGTCEQTFHSPVTRTIFGKLEESISATSTQTVGGNISITSTGGTITITSPTEITLNAPKVTNKATGQWFKSTGFAVELYGSKNSLGVQKFDHAGINLSTNSFKMERTKVALSWTDLKTEKTGIAVARTELKLETMGARFQDCPINIEKDAIQVQKGAFASITKAFLKIG